MFGQFLDISENVFFGSGAVHVRQFIFKISAPNTISYDYETYLGYGSQMD